MERPTTRVLAVLELLQTHARISGSALSKSIDVDGRTMRRYIAILEELGIPINWHQGTSFVRPGPLKYSNPILLEDIAVACPDLTMIISHMGHPWETECVVLIRKHPRLFADTSALHYRPLRHYQAFMTALEYGVEDKLIFGSDFPSATPEQAIAGLWKVNDVVRGTQFPKFPDEALNRIIYENWKQAVRF